MSLPNFEPLAILTNGPRGLHLTNTSLAPLPLPGPQLPQWLPDLLSQVPLSIPLTQLSNLHPEGCVNNINTDYIMPRLAAFQSLPIIFKRKPHLLQAVCKDLHNLPASVTAVSSHHVPRLVGQVLMARAFFHVFPCLSCHPNRTLAGKRLPPEILLLSWPCPLGSLSWLF